MKSIIITALSLGLTFSVSAIESPKLNAVHAKQQITQAINDLKSQIEHKVKDDIKQSVHAISLKNHLNVQTNKFMNKKNMITMNQQE